MIVFLSVSQHSNTVCFSPEFHLWGDFCIQVKERYNLVYHHRNFESHPSLSLQRKKAELVQQLAEAIFFPVDNYSHVS